MNATLLRPPAGTELVSSLAALVPAGSWVRGFGVVRELRVEIEAGGHATTAVDHEGAAQIASLDAYVDAAGAVVSVVASLPVAGTAIVAAGRATRAIVVDVTLLVLRVALDDAPPNAASPAAAPAPAPRAASPAAAPATAQSQPMRAAASAPAPARPAPAPAPAPTRVAPTPAPASQWAQVAALSGRVADATAGEPDPVEVDELERGDVLLHPSLGRCVFLQGIDNDAARVKLPNGSPQKLMLRVFDIVPTADPKTYNLRKRES